VLAYHFREAGDDERTLRYATLAGDNAGRLYANAEAAAQYATAIEAARRREATAEAIGHLYPSRGRVLELSGRYDEAVATYEEMAALARDAGDRGGVLGAEMALTTIHATPTPVFDGSKGRELAERTIALARELGDRSAESKALWNLMILDVFGGGDADEAVDAGERSLEIARELNAREQIAFTLNDLWRPYAAVGQVSAARACLEEARPIWRRWATCPCCARTSSAPPRYWRSPVSRSRPWPCTTRPTRSPRRSAIRGGRRTACSTPTSWTWNRATSAGPWPGCVNASSAPRKPGS
jgi:tetratricopeptide (TPR) repeat protein